MGVDFYAEVKDIDKSASLWSGKGIIHIENAYSYRNKTNN